MRKGVAARKDAKADQLTLLAGKILKTIQLENQRERSLNNRIGCQKYKLVLQK